jgi:hypothetical protein
MRGMFLNKCRLVAEKYVINYKLRFEAQVFHPRYDHISAAKKGMSDSLNVLTTYCSEC